MPNRNGMKEPEPQCFKSRMASQGKGWDRARLMLLNVRNSEQEGDLMPTPNDQCPCGSGKQYKDCCGKGK